MDTTLNFVNDHWGRKTMPNNVTYTNSLNLFKTLRKYLFRLAKGKSMINFYIINALSKFRTLHYCCKRPKSVISDNLLKTVYVWATKWPTSSELKKFDPSLDRSWRNFFKIIGGHSPKNLPPGCDLGPKLFSLSGHISKLWTAQ